MRKLFIFIIFILAITYSSCQRKGQTVFLSENLRFVQPDTTIHLNGKLLSFEDNPPIGMSNINCIDSFLLFSLRFQSKDSSYFLKAYNKFNHKFLGNLISKGNGPDEFLSVVYRDQFYLSGDSIKIYLHDLSREQLYAINLTSSIFKTKTEISKEFGKLPRWTLKAFHYQDSLLLLKRIDNTGLVYELFNSQKGEKIRQFLLYSVNIGRDNYDKFNSIDYLQFENQKIAMPMMFMNQVNILDLKDADNIAITTKKNHPSWDNIKKKENSELNVYYID
ncbi:MAG: hypothetical protein PHS48_05900, partial [Bacteroidales bacterium]|nr:hypothetical protein [Bacteroidales bacterium]